MNLPNLEQTNDEVTLSHLFKELPRLTTKKDNLSSEYLEWVSNNFWDYYCLVLWNELLNQIDYLNTTNKDSSEVVKALGNSLVLHSLLLIADDIKVNHYRKFKLSRQDFSRLEISYKVRDYQVTSLEERLYDKLVPILTDVSKIGRGHIRFSKFVKMYRLDTLDKSQLNLLELFLWTFN